MKYLALNIMLSIAFTVGTKAQDTITVQKANFANWVVESNIKTPRNSVIKFYNAQQELIYQEEIKGKRINVSRPKTQTKLNEILAQLARKDTQVTPYNLVAVSLKRN